MVNSRLETVEAKVEHEVASLENLNYQDVLDH